MNSTNHTTRTTASRTPHSRPVVKSCRCGQPAVRYVTAEGIKTAPYCSDCAKG